jgi:hypothetical protein
MDVIKEEEIPFTETSIENDSLSRQTLHFLLLIIIFCILVFTHDSIQINYVGRKDYKLLDNLYE